MTRFARTLYVLLSHKNLISTEWIVLIKYRTVIRVFYAVVVYLYFVFSFPVIDILQLTLHTQKNHLLDYPYEIDIIVSFTGSYNKQLLDEVLVISRIIKVEVCPSMML